jgi:hypothetical protein
MGFPHDYTGHIALDGHYVQLCVSEIERLAKAGVQIGLKDITPVSDPMPAPPAPPFMNDWARLEMAELNKAFWERWLLNRRAMSPTAFGGLDGVMRPYVILASVVGDKVHISVHPSDNVTEPFTLVDDRATYPSDTLLASLKLWEKTHELPRR